MKNSKINITNLNRLISKGLFNSSFIILLLICSSLKAQNENHSPLHGGVGYCSFLSGNGHGVFFSAFFSLNKDRKSFSIGPCVQRSSQQIRSIKICYSYKVADNDGRLGLRLFTYLFYADKLPISYSTIKLEEREARTAEKWEPKPYCKTQWNDIRLSTIETGCGVELGVKIMNGIMLRNYIGLSVFYHTNYYQAMYSDRVGPVLTMGTSLNIYNVR